MVLTDYERDMLKEMGNVGSGNAITSLSRMLDNVLIDVNLPELHLLKGSMIDELHPDDTYTVHSRIDGDLKGCVSFHFTRKEALKILNNSTFKNQNIDRLNELGKDVLVELGNIMGNTYSASIGEFLGFDLLNSKSLLCLDKDRSIEELKSLGEDLVKLNTLFSVYDDEVFSKIWLVLDDESANKILSRIK